MKSADLIFSRGNIYLGARQVAAPPYVQVLPRVEALAVRDERIVSAGTAAQVNGCAGARTRRVDLRGAFVMPGCNDAHLHLVAGGFEKLNVSLRGAKSLPDMTSRIAARAQTAAAGEWIRGRGWDQTLWGDSRLPTRRDLDEVTAGHPAMFHRADSHIAVVNSAALRAAGITEKTPDPPAGRIDRDSSGEPTGILRETAMDLVAGKIPPPGPGQRRRAIELALREAAQWGVTSVQDNSDWENYAVFGELEREGKLTLRIREWLDFNAPLELLQARRGPGSSRLATGMLKGFLDGSLGSRTAALLSPYADDPGNAGLPRYQQVELDRMVAERARAGFQIGLHAIGDAAVEMALNAFSYARRQGVDTGALRLRVEHAQVTTPTQASRFRELGVIASMQPNHLLTDMNWAEARLGRERARRAYAWAEFLQQGVGLALGTDFPIEPITPLRGIYAAVTRHDEAGTREYFPEQRLTVEQAIAAYSSGAAYAEFAEKEKGTLERGMLADFVVLDRDITRIAPADILRTQVLRTVVGGKTVYARG